MRGTREPVSILASNLGINWAGLLSIRRVWRARMTGCSSGIWIDGGFYATVAFYGFEGTTGTEFESGEGSDGGTAYHNVQRASEN